ncbi:apolipoprotein D isoform X2 [Aplysia californica]|uniref:Apolipoprotein D isoform X2 n=1 Tax=Aplysia californica TaxID=6500 RepID=A0ABM0K420_APLCA|nr:apolipoprotein D isoform X2 [Aplysia californica]
MSSLKLTSAVSSAVLVLLSTLLSSAAAQGVVLRPGRCPATGTQAAFDPSRYLGTWYEYERFDNWFEAGMDCVRAEYGLNPDQTISVLNAGTRTFKLFGRTIFSRPASINGDATTPDPASPAQLKVSFSQFDVIGGNEPNYYIVETDYDNYAVVFSCFNLPGLPVNIQFAWILTRDRGVAPANLNAIKSNLQAAGVRTKYFKSVNQADCPVV